MSLKLRHKQWVKTSQGKNWEKSVDRVDHQPSALSNSDCHLPITEWNERASSFQ